MFKKEKSTRCIQANSTQVERVRMPDNQQERPEYKGWIVGFTDGEGCFSASVFRNKTSTLGWQIFPEFVLTQGISSRSALKKCKLFLDVERFIKTKGKIITVKIYFAFVFVQELIFWNGLFRSLKNILFVRKNNTILNCSNKL